MTALRTEVRPGAYYDSIVLMQLQRSLAGLPGVRDAAVVMATKANLELLEASGLRGGELAAAGDGDLAIAVRAESAAAAEDALAQVDRLLARRRAAEGAEASGYRPRSLSAAARSLPEARWVLISVPGRYAARLAREALELERSVFLYSDHVSLADEVALKRRAAERGLLVMGPDCGTAVIGGVGLGFANRLRRGPVGLVGASGTGLQAVSSRLDALGIGISQVIGTGGRDLSAEVGAITARQGLALLARDPETRVIVVISKPPAPAVAARLAAEARSAGKPVVLSLVGAAPPIARLGSVRFARSLDDAAELAAELVAGEGLADAARPPAAAGERRYLRGLFAGGTLAVECLHALEGLLDPLLSNVPLRPEQQAGDTVPASGHLVLDLGADDYTLGRPHPMIDQELRLRRLHREAEDPEVAVVLLDVVLGDGAHPDPAAELAPAIAACREGGGPQVVALLVGTAGDPQDLTSQAERLEASGAVVVRGVGEAVEAVLHRLPAALPEPLPEVELDLLAPSPAVIDVGLESFHESLLERDVRALHVDWRPPAGGDEKLARLLEKMRS